MAAYYMFVNHDKGERVDPGRISNVKRFWAAFGDSGRLLGYLMLHRWHMDRVEAQSDDVDREEWGTYIDVTAEAVAEFNRDSLGMVPAIVAKP